MALTNHYHRSRKVLVLFSGMLMGWEFLGIDIGSHVELPVSRTSVTIRHPHVVPSVILLLVLYFFIRLIIEWMQCEEEDRAKPVCKVDFILSCSLALVGVAVALIQGFSGVEIGSHINTRIIITFVLGIFYGLGLRQLSLSIVWGTTWRIRTKRWLTPIATGIVILITYAVVRLFSELLDPVSAGHLLGFFNILIAAGLLSMLAATFYYEWLSAYIAGRVVKSLKQHRQSE